MTQLKLPFLSGVAALICSCAPNSPSPQASRAAVGGNQVILNGQASKAQKEKARAYVAGKYGGFSQGKWGNPDLSTAIVVSINGKFGSGRFYDSRGAYNSAMTEGFETTASPGKIAVISKPGHYQIPGVYEDRFEFNAKAGHEYFIGYKIDEWLGKARWVPVVYDKTAESVVPLSGVKPQVVGMHIAPTPIYLPVG